MVTSGRSCEQIHELYGGDRGEEILDGVLLHQLDRER